MYRRVRLPRRTSPIVPLFRHKQIKNNCPGKWVSLPNRIFEWGCRSSITKRRNPIFIANHYQRKWNASNRRLKRPILLKETFNLERAGYILETDAFLNAIMTISTVERNFKLMVERSWTLRLGWLCFNLKYTRTDALHLRRNPRSWRVLTHFQLTTRLWGKTSYHKDNRKEHLFPWHQLIAKLTSLHNCHYKN